MERETALLLEKKINNLPQELWHYSYRTQKSGKKPLYYDNSVGGKRAQNAANHGLRKSLQAGRFCYKFKRTTDLDTHWWVTFNKNILNGYVKDLVQSRTGLKNIKVLESFISCYDEGDFLSMHHDKQGDCAFVLNLTRDWLPEYGGLLHIKNEGDDNTYTAINPTFNSLVLMELKGGGRDHFVSEVSALAPGPRLAISGWYVEQ